MKTLIIYDNSGYIYIQITGTYRIPQGGINYIEIYVESYKGKKIKSVNVETKELVLEDVDTRVEDINTYLEGADDSTISKVEDTILETEKNKTIENGGM